MEIKCSSLIRWPPRMSNKIVASNALHKRTYIWFSSHHVQYLQYSSSRCFVRCDFCNLGWAFFMNIVSALVIAFSLPSTLGLKSLYLNDAPSFLNFATSCKIFIVNIHFSMRKSTLSLNDLVWTRSTSWQIALVVELTFDVSSLTWLFSWAIASF